MHWLCKSLLGTATGLLTAAAPVLAQPTHIVTLGRPTPLPAGMTGVVHAAPVEPLTNRVLPAALIVRGARPTQEGEPKAHALPQETPALDDSIQPGKFLPFVVEVSGDKNVEKLHTPRFKTPALEESVVILDERQPLFDWTPAAAPSVYAGGEFLLWTARGFHVPGLILSASPNTPLATRGILGVDPTARIILGDENFAGGVRPGARFTLGYNLDPCGWCTLEASGFFLGRRSQSFAFNSTEIPVLGRPFFDLNNGVPSRELTTSPDQGPGTFGGAGGVRVDASSILFGAEANLRSLLWVGCNYEVTGYIGYRYLDLSDRLAVTENTLILRDIPFTPPDVPVFAGTQVTVFDRFNTRNRFHGGQIGLDTQWQRDRWTLEAKARVALGVTRQSIDIDGGQRLLLPNGTTQSFVGGLYALPSNIGHHAQSRFSVVPEVGVKLGYDLTEHVRLFVGYDFLYWSSVVRPGDQMDPVLDLNQVPQSGRPYPPATQVRPVVPFRTTSYWAQGVNVGLEIRY